MCSAQVYAAQMESVSDSKPLHYATDRNRITSTIVARVAAVHEPDLIVRRHHLSDFRGWWSTSSLKISRMTRVGFGSLINAVEELRSDNERYKETLPRSVVVLTRGSSVSSV